MPKKKKLDTYISMAKDLLDNPGEQENEKQVELGKLWETMTKADQAKATKWIEETLIDPTTSPVMGMKHLIECNCSLPQYKNRADRIFHKFVVFSVIDENGKVEPKHVQCNNCGAIHRVVEIGKSEFTGRDESHSILTIEDARRSISQDVREVLEDYKMALPYWEEAAFIFEHQRWGSHFVLSSEPSHDEIVTKILRFIGPGMIKIETLTDQASIT